MRWVTVGDMYQSVKGTDTKLLSSFNSNFWSQYIAQHTYYDRLFNRMFGSFRFFDQAPLHTDLTEQHIAETRLDFTDAVYDLLLVNDKKFSELYRINVIDDEKYSIFNNYDIVETKEEERASTGTDNIGQKTVTDTNTYGSATDSNTHVEGARTDTTNETKGSKTDSSEDVIGARSDSDNLTQGAQSNSKEQGIAGFNSNDYSDDSMLTESLGARTDTAGHTQGQQTNTHSETQGQQVNNLSNVKGEMTVTDTKNIGGRSDTLTHLHGAQANTYEHGDTVSYMLTRKGNIGVRTVTEIIEQHKEFWSVWEFYSYIFKEICAELLLI